MDLQITKEMLELHVDEIQTNPYHLRKYFDEGKLKILAESIKEHDLETPITLRWNTGSENGFKATIKDGERRYRALKIAGYKTLRYGKEFIYTAINQDFELEIGALIANCMREDLTPIEKGQALMSILRKRGIKSRKIAKNAIDRAKDYVNNDFLSEPSSRNYFVTKEIIRDIARDMKSIGLGGTNSIDLLSLLDLPQDIQKKIVYGENNNKITKEKVRLSRTGRMMKREKNDQGTVIPMAYGKALARLPEDKIVRFFLKEAFGNSWTARRLMDMITDFLSSGLTSEQYIKAYGARLRENVCERRSGDLKRLASSMDRMSSTLTSFRTINLVAMASEFDKKNVAISGIGLKKSSENLVSALDGFIQNVETVSRVKEETRSSVENIVFCVVLRQPPHQRTPAYRFTIPVEVGNLIKEQHDFQDGDLLELTVHAVVRKGEGDLNLNENTRNL